MRRPGVSRARDLRRRSGGPERKLWRAIKARQLEGFHFRRQYRIGPYYADFACLKAALVIEIDGRGHDTDAPAERRRQAYIESRGFRVLRFSNEDVLHEFEGVITAILAALPDPRE